MVGSASAFLMQVVTSPRTIISSGVHRPSVSSVYLPIRCRHPASMASPASRASRGKKLLSTIAEDDPWVLLEEFKVWTILNRGTYDLIEFQNAINNLRRECQLNIHTLENEIASIQQTMIEQTLQQREDIQDNTIEDIVVMPALKAVFAGYQTTDEDRLRLQSAHPEG